MTLETKVWNPHPNPKWVTLNLLQSHLAIISCGFVCKDRPNAFKGQQVTDKKHCAVCNKIQRGIQLTCSQITLDNSFLFWRTDQMNRACNGCLVIGHSSWNIEQQLFRPRVNKLFSTVTNPSLPNSCFHISFLLQPAHWSSLSCLVFGTH